MIRPLLFIVGYHILGFPAERSADIVNICAELGVIYHDLGVSGEGESRRRRIRVSPAASAKLSRVCARFGIEVAVERRHGLPELALGIIRRPGIIAGAVMSAFILIASQTVIWDVRIEGNEHMTDEAIEELLESCGVGVGSSKRALDIDKIENRALIMSDDISWISVNVVGNVASVEVREVSAEPEDKGKDFVASNLVATRNGTVAELFEVRGNIAVELGEAVSEGQLLVGGIYGSDTEGMRLVRSKGQVIALCEREYNVQIPLKYSKKAYTGREKVKKSLIFFKKEVKFFGNSRNLYTSCDTIDTVEYFNFFGLGELPIGIRTVRYVEYKTVEATRSEQVAAAEANATLWRLFLSDAPEASVASKTLDGHLEGDTYILIARIESLENIAEEREIKVDIVG